MRWAELETAIDQHEWARALTLAVDGWRECRQAPFADLIDTLSKRTLSPPIAGRDADAFQAAWLGRSRSAGPADYAMLLSTVTRSLPMPHEYYWAEGTARTRYAAWLTRLDALAALPDDPRTSTALFEIVRKGPLASAYPVDVATTYDPALDLIGRIADERLLEPLRALVKTPTASRQVVRRYLVEAVPIRIEAIEDARAKRKPLDQADVEQCERLIEALGGQTSKRARSAGPQDEAPLFALVVDNPDDDDAREVLADHWLERGDPRGELVALQLKVARGTATATDQKRIRALLREHEKAWLGDITLVTKSRVFKRGFLDEMELLQNAAADPRVWEAVPLDARLGTVRTIHKGKANEQHYRRFVFSASARSLRELTVISKNMLRDVCARAEPWPIEHLALAFMPDKKALAGIARSNAFPYMAKLTAGVSEGKVANLIELAVAFVKERPLASVAAAPIRWYRGTDSLAEWLSAIVGPLAHVPMVEVVFLAHRNNRIIARRGKAGLRLELACDHLYFAEEILPQLRDVEHVTLRLPEGAPAPRYQDSDEAARLIGAISAPIEMDAGWRNFLARTGSS